MTTAEVERIERASALRRGGRGLVRRASAASGRGPCTWCSSCRPSTGRICIPSIGGPCTRRPCVCALRPSSRCCSRRRLLVIAAGSDPASNDDAGQLLFLAQLGLLVGAINLALILLEGSYVLFIPRG